MKKILFILFAVIVASCTNNVEEVIENSKESYEVIFNTLNTTITRASVKESPIQYIYVYVDGEYYATQDKTSDIFGIISIILEKGEHTISFVGADKVINNCSITGAIGENIYGKTINITVDSKTPAQNITLERLVTELKLTFNDSFKNAGVTRMTITSKFYNIFNPKTLYAVDIEEITKDINTTTYTAGKEIYLAFMCPSDTFTNDIVITLYKGNSVFTTYNMTNTPFERNAITTISGNWCSTSSGMNITVNTDWGKETNLSID